MAKFPFDDRSIRALPAPAKGIRVDYDDGPVRGLAIQTSYTGSQRFLLVYVARGSGRERRMVIGEYGRAPKLSVAAARRLAAEKRALVDLGRDPWLEAKEAREQARKQAERHSATFGNLLAAYVEHLKAAGKASWPEVQGAIGRHVTPRTKLAATPADQITIDAVMPVFHSLIRQGKLREAEKLRSYMRAAYTAARKARTDASMHAFEDFTITTHPLLDLSVSRPKEAAEKAAAAARERKWAFSEAQLAAYWRRIKADPSPAGALLRFHLLTGGQRVKQLTRLTVDDYDTDARTVTLRDAKGRRRTVYEHVVPLLPEAVEALEAMRTADPAGTYLFTLTAGKTAATYDSLWEATQVVGEAMVKAGELPRLFSPGTIRKTVETRLAAKGVSREIRGRLLSHGLGGVQDTHYDDHSYMPEKRATLEKLRALLEPKGEKVIKFPARAG